TAYVAKNQHKGLVVSDDIASRYKIALEYLLKVMQLLVKANILRSKRGPRGGFSLARKPNKITMLEIIEAVQGPLTSDMLLREHAPREKFAANAEKASKKAFNNARSTLKAVTLANLL
ncbi:MAG: Rrf2 family transcriptional regulator, partial [Planctomycetota bacterium]